MTETTEAHAAVVEVRGLVKRYGDEGRRRAEGNVTLALDHVGFSVGAGEFLGLMGPSGLGQDHAAQLPRHHRRAHGGTDRGGRPGR